MRNVILLLTLALSASGLATPWFIDGFGTTATEGIPFEILELADAAIREGCGGEGVRLVEHTTDEDWDYRSHIFTLNRGWVSASERATSAHATEFVLDDYACQ